jgi:hypothetical protein
VNTDDLIREALFRQADRAPAPGPTLAALRRPRRRRRAPLFVAVAVTASVLAAIALTVTRPSVETAPPATATTSTAPSLDASLRYGPEWLPDGFTEQKRTLDLENYSRTWVDEGKDVDLTVMPAGSKQEKAAILRSLYERSQDRVDLGAQGTAKYLDSPEPTVATLVWSTGGDLLTLRVSGLPDARVVVRQIAESMRSDGQGVQRVVLRLATEYPEERSAGNWTDRTWTGSSPTEWTISVAVARSSRFTVVRLTPTSPDTAGGYPVRARGVDATYVAGAGGMLVVPVGDYFLTIGGDPLDLLGMRLAELTLDQLIAIADTTEVAEKPDLGWFGSR